MAEILEEQTLEIENVLSFRGEIKQEDLETVGKDMEEKIVLAGAVSSGNPITVTYGVENDIFDIEILLPVNKNPGIRNIGKYIFKDKIKIVNAVVAKHKGSLSKLQDTCRQLNQYILDKGLIPITAGYNVTNKINPVNEDSTEVDVYVGISPNIL